MEFCVDTQSVSSLLHYPFKKKNSAETIGVYRFPDFNKSIVGVSFDSASLCRSLHPASYEKSQRMFLRFFGCVCTPNRIYLRLFVQVYCTITKKE